MAARLAHCERLKAGKTWLPWCVGEGVEGVPEVTHHRYTAFSDEKIFRIQTDSGKVRMISLHEENQFTEKVAHGPQVP